MGFVRARLGNKNSLLPAETAISLLIQRQLTL
jgi:hypothetical protein